MIISHLETREEEQEERRRSRGAQIWRWGPHGSCCCPSLPLCPPAARPPLPLLTYSTLSSPPNPTPPEGRGGAEVVKERSLAALKEERRERSAYEGAELSERQRFSLFSVAVRSSHEKERTRAERTKNWSLIGSLLGTLLGVLGSTYINRVRLQELRSLLLEAQKGPESLQEVLRVQAVQHRRQHGELQALVDTLGGAVGHAHQATPGHAPTPTAPPTADSPLAGLQPHLAHLDGGVTRLEKGVVGLEGGVAQLDRGVAQVAEGLSRLEGGVARLEGGVAAFRSLEEEEGRRRRRRSSSVAVPGRVEGVLEEEVLLRRVEEARERLEEAVQRSGVTNSAVTVVAAAITVPLLYFLLRAAA
ncbi:hypothetical protein CRUP_031327 [Coryphaenoides rupestris]|nr:hypothetical protein CRUP_031327 [Coryphaenoides rupestris]